MGVVVQRDDRREIVMKGNDGDEWNSDGMVLWLGRRQNRDVAEWWEEWLRLRWHFYNIGGWESGYLGTVVGIGGTDLMVWFQLESGGDMMKRYRKMKWMQRARLPLEGSVTQRGDIDWRRGGTREGKEMRWRQLSWCRFYWTEKCRKIMQSI
jgi:hypothetical protein